TITASPGTSFTFAVTSGGLPGGLALAGTSGVLSGTANAVGSFSFTVTATDANGCNGSQSYSISIATNPTSGSVVISQIFGGGGLTGAPYQNDFSELHNRTCNPISLSGWSVQYSAATGAFGNATLSTSLTGTIAAGGYFLVQEHSGGTNGSLLPTADVVANVDLSSTNGKVALVSSTTLLTGTCGLDASVVDLVGYGTTPNCFEGTGPTGTALSSTAAASRNHSGCTDTNDNSADFTTGTPAARDSATAPFSCVTIAIGPTSLPNGLTKTA